MRLSGGARGSAGERERGEAGAHVGDQLVADAHQREPEQVLAAVAAVGIAGAQMKSLGLSSASGCGWVNSSAEWYGSSVNLPRSPHSITSNLTRSQSGRSSVSRPARFAPAAVPDARMTSNCRREVALHA